MRDVCMICTVMGTKRGGKIKTKDTSIGRMEWTGVRPRGRARRAIVRLSTTPLDDDDAMINADGENVDLYIPRKCSWTNRLITAADKGSVQMNIGHLDANGVYSGSYTTVALAGYVRAKVRKRRSRANEDFIYSRANASR